MPSRARTGVTGKDKSRTPRMPGCQDARGEGKVAAGCNLTCECVGLGGSRVGSGCVGACANECKKCEMLTVRVGSTTTITTTTTILLYVTIEPVRYRGAPFPLWWRAPNDYLPGEFWVRFEGRRRVKQSATGQTGSSLRFRYVRAFKQHHIITTIVRIVCQRDGC